MGLVVGEGGGLVEFFKTVELDLASVEFWRRRADVFAEPFCSNPGCKRFEVRRGNIYPNGLRRRRAYMLG